MNRLLCITTGLLATAFTVAGCTIPPAQENTGWTALIDGTTGLDNWGRIGDANWRAQDNAIQADKKTGKPAGFLLSKNTYGDFQIKAEFWSSDDANSGIFIRCKDPGTLSAKTCYEVNIFDRRPDPKYGTGAIVDFAAVSPMPKAGGKWNTYEITAKGTHLTVILNGVRTADIQDGTHARGPIALQYDGGIVKFRKLEIKPL
jgi:hypothetical protein